MKKKNLTVKQKAFCENYIITGNATQSYKNAGYSSNSYANLRKEGSRLLKKPEIQAYIDELMKEKDSLLIAKQDEVLEFLTATMRNEGANNSDRIRAAELLGKRYATFVEKKEIENNGTIEINIAD